jgi:hypothetical protein
MQLRALSNPNARMPIFAPTADWLTSTYGGHHEHLVAESDDPDWAASDGIVEGGTRMGFAGIAPGNCHFGKRGGHTG